MDLRDRHVLITGGSKGLGAALARETSSRGARVTLAARPSPQLDAVASATGGLALPVDLSEVGALDGYVARAEDAAGPLDVVINNAALVSAGRIDSLSEAQLRAQIITNLLAPMELTRQALPGMTARDRGIVVNVSSMVAELGIPNLPAYVSAKAGLTKFTLDLQADLRRMGTPVRALLCVLGEIPGTQINDGFRSDATVAALADRFARLPVLSVESAARDITDCVIRGRRGTIVLPRYNSALFHLRQLPIRATSRLASAGSRHAPGSRTPPPP